MLFPLKTCLDRMIVGSFMAGAEAEALLQRIAEYDTRGVADPAFVKPAVMFLDILLPGKSGLQVMQDNPAAVASLPVVAMTGTVDAAAVESYRCAARSLPVRHCVNSSTMCVCVCFVAPA